DSLTKYLPEKCSHAVQFAQFGRQTRIVINNRLNDFIPNPTFERVAAPGSSWICPLFHDFADLQKKMPQNFGENPHDVFRRNIWVSPFWEGCVADVVEAVGWDKVLFGSDYPHPEGLAEPKG